MVLKHSAHKQ